jgi:hypothetical protein
MPCKTTRDTRLWSKAKARARVEYPDISEESDRFWQIVRGIYDRMRGAKKSLSGGLYLSLPRARILFKAGGRGRMGRQARGLGGECVCPSCGATVPHRRAKPCDTIKCPKCGATMTRKPAKERLGKARRGEEVPGHKYIRRERGKKGNYRYWYPGGNGDKRTQHKPPEGMTVTAKETLRVSTSYGGNNKARAQRARHGQILFTKEIDRKAKKQYRYGNEWEKQMIVAHFFNPYGPGDWWLLNCDPDDPDYCWGFAELDELECGSFSRSELEGTVINLRIGAMTTPGAIERDKFWQPINAKEFWDKKQGEREH